MSIINKYILDIQTKGANASQKAIGGVTTSLGSMAKKMGVVAGAYFGSQALIAGIKGSINAYAEQERVEKQLSTALGKSTTALKNQASALQQQTKFGDEATLAQMSYLASIGLTEQQISEMIPVAMDLASATGMSLESAVRNTSKTLSGMTGELGESVPALRELTAEQLKAGEGVRVLGEMFKGMAESDAKTLGGAMTQAGNAVGDVAEVIGGKLAPVVIKVAGVIKTFAESTDAFLDWADGVNSTTEATKAYNQQAESSQRLLDKLKSDFNLTTDETKGLADQLLDVQEQLHEMGKSQMLQGRWANAFIDGSHRATNSLELLLETIRDYAEFAPEIEEVNARVGYSFQGIKEASEPAKVSIQEYGSQLDNSIPKQSLFDDILGFSSMTWLEMKENSQRSVNMIASGTLQLGKAHKNLGKSAEEGAKRVVISAGQKAVAELIAGMMTRVPFPLNLALAGGAGAMAGTLFQGAVDSLSTLKLAEGFNGIVSSPTLMLTGEDGAERVSVTNLEKPDGGANAGGGGITLNISAPLVDESVVDHIIPAIERANRMRLA